MARNRYQFEGLGTYPNVSAAEMKNVNACVVLANDDSDPRQSRYADHVNAALGVAQAAKAQPDRSPHGLYAWLRAGYTPPGGSLIKYGTHGGLDFYTLDDEAFNSKPLYGARQ